MVWAKVSIESSIWWLLHFIHIPIAWVINWCLKNFRGYIGSSCNIKVSKERVMLAIILHVCVTITIEIIGRCSRISKSLKVPVCLPASRASSCFYYVYLTRRLEGGGYFCYGMLHNYLSMVVETNIKITRGVLRHVFIFVWLINIWMIESTI